ncbi:MAG: hypothetical protein PHW76_06905 [Alphaproteobacteria bacterium]|nr:hypothetical protein [Alphaproteobacteria bacterium]
MDIALDVLENGWGAFDESTMAKCWVHFSKRRSPVLIGITSKERGLELGYVAIHRFLAQVGVNRVFQIAWLARSDAAFFDKLADSGLIEELRENREGPRAFRVKKDPMEALYEYAHGPRRPTKDDHGAEFDFEPDM